MRISVLAVCAALAAACNKSASGQNWTATMDGTYETTGTAIAPTGAVYPKCSEAHVIACCQ